ncbi:MAG TPA: mobilization protein [Hyphomicrobium zavarzinii]|nr:mobilization protein [Hyphomicrobium zavarzinii]
MARQSLAKRIEQMEAKAASLKARLSEQERRQDTRRKVLLGAFVLHHLHHQESKNGEVASLRWLLAERLPGYLTRPADRALFADLLARPEEAPSPYPTPIGEDAL